MSRANGQVPPQGGPPLNWPDTPPQAAAPPRAPVAPALRRPMQANGVQPNGGAMAHGSAAPQAQPQYHYPPQAARPAAPHPQAVQAQPQMTQSNFDLPPQRAPSAPRYEPAFDPQSAAYQTHAASGQHNGTVDSALAHASAAAHRMARNPVPRQDGYVPDPRQPQQVRTHQGHQQAYPQTTRGWPGGDGQPQPQQYHPQGQGPAGYDLGSYPSGGAGYGVAGQRQVMDLGAQDPGLSALDRGARRGPQAPDLADYGVAPQQGTQPQDGMEYAGEEYYEPEPEPARSRKWLIVGTLVGAIAVGGGMAYAYRKFTEPRSADGRTPVVAANKTPVKARPTDASGKEVAQPEKKFLNKLGDSSSEQASGRAVEDGVPRKVATYAVGKDGTLVQQAAPPPPAQNNQSQPLKQASAGIPGMIVDMPAPRVPQGAPQAEAPAPQPQPQPRAAPQQPLPQPRVESGGAPPVQPKVIQVPPRVAAVQPAPVPQPQPQPQAQAAPPPVAPQQRQPVPKERPAVAQTATGAGFVAALISKRSQMEALAAMADFQQRYGQALQGRTATVQEANLGEKGVWYRVVVGPPGSREAASTVCTQLKGQGHQGCWVTSY